jgi:hypothetical protein
VNLNVAVEIVGRLAGLLTGPVKVTISVVKKPVANMATMPKPQAFLRIMGKVRAIFRNED